MRCGNVDGTILDITYGAMSRYALGATNNDNEQNSDGRAGLR